MSEPVFSDYEVRRVMNQFYARSQMEEGGDTKAYRLAKGIRDAVEKAILVDSIEKVMADCVPWQEATFPHATPKSIATHLAREAVELRDNPNDWSEMADIILLLGHLAHKTGVDLAKVAREKLELNMRRKWGVPDADGVVEHQRDYDPDDPSLLINIFADAVEAHDNLLTRIIENKEVGQIFVPPAIPTYEIDEQGVPTGRRMVWQNLSGGEHGWEEIDQKTKMDPDHAVLLDMRHGVSVQEGTEESKKDFIDGSSYPTTVRYLRRTHQVSP